MFWLEYYVMLVPDLECMDNTTLLLDGRGEMQPDAMLWRPVPGGPYLNDDGFVEGAPELIVEVAASSASYDLHEKKEAYRRNGVGEYLIWRVLDKAIDWFRLIDGEYFLIAPDGDGTIESEQFPGLRLHVSSMLAGNRAALVARMGGPPRP
jgi:Uma2 family endonuclease